LPRTVQGRLDVWVHFDAKYRIERLAQQLTPRPADEEAAQASAAEDVETHARSRREDLLKMHAYRDAIHRTAGAYVLYPGDEPIRVTQFTELLPGLGAFPLRPGDEGARGSADLRAFLSDVLTHVGQQASHHERDRFWSAAINTSGPAAPRGLSPVTFLDQPPADTDVLLAYVRGPEHRAWIERTRLYNVRADDRPGSVSLDSRELGAPLILLYEPTAVGLQVVSLMRPGSWRAIHRDDLVASGYPQPGGNLYFVTTLDPIAEAPPWLGRISLTALLPPSRQRGAPCAVTWWDLLTSTT
jgi:hypothetical protein